MSLVAGTRLGPYEILRLIGAGGMGEVYLAHDTRLSREVALKVLQADLAGNPDRLYRFEREARAASALSHPAIVSIYDIGQADGHWFIAMELVEGHPLRALLAGRALPTRRLLDIGTPVAQGLARAHRSGIVHRDLKPENVMVSSDGVVKIVDFGIAKLLSSLDNAEDETVRAQHQTEPGAILGTVSYMSPEQASGRPVDARSDQFSLGTMLMEMATGRHPFLRETTPQTQTAILEHHPAPIRASNPEVPLPLAWVIERCLAKDPDERYASTDDLARDLARVRDHLSDPDLRVAVVQKQQAAAGRSLLFFASLAIVAGGVWWAASAFSPPPSANSQPSHLAMLLSGDLQYTSSFTFEGAVSADGKSLVFAARSGIASAQQNFGNTQLYLRDLANPTPRLLGKGGKPFWSPDGQWIGFWDGDVLKKMRPTGEPVVDIAQVAGTGPNWDADGTILLSDRSDRPTRGIQRLTPGGTVQDLTFLDQKFGHTHHMYPQSLPGGRLLYTIRSDGPKFDLAVQAMENGTPKIVLSDAAFGSYIGDGLLLFQRGRILLAAYLDLESLTVGTAVPVAEDVFTLTVGRNWTYGGGTLVYRPANEPGRALEWVSDGGQPTPLEAPVGQYANPRLSPSGTLVAVQVADGAASDVVVIDAAGRIQPVSNDRQSRVPVWTPDGTHLIVHRRTSQSDLFKWPLDGRGSPVPLTRTGRAQGAAFVAPDGTVTYHQEEPGFTYDLWQIPGDGAGEPRPFVRTPELEAGARLHPAGQWVAYAARRSGRDEIWLASYPDGQSSIRVATDGSREPIWSHDGRTLFYRLGTKMLAVPFQDGRPPVLGRQRQVFDGPYFIAGGPGNTQYDVAKDGRFLMLKEQDDKRPYLVVLQQWRNKLTAALASSAK